MPFGLRTYEPDKLLQRLVKCPLFYILEREEDHRIPGEMFFKRLCISDGKAVKDPPVASGLLFSLVALEKITKHGEVQGLPETPRAGNEKYFCPCIRYFLNHERLVYKQKSPCPEFPEITYAYSYSFFHKIFVFSPITPCR